MFDCAVCLYCVCFSLWLNSDLTRNSSCFLSLWSILIPLITVRFFPPFHSSWNIFNLCWHFFASHNSSSADGTLKGSLSERFKSSSNRFCLRCVTNKYMHAYTKQQVVRNLSLLLGLQALHLMLHSVTNQGLISMPQLYLFKASWLIEVSWWSW